MINSVDSALKTFENAATLYAKAIEEGDSKTANKNFDLIDNCVDYLKANDALHELKKFFLHINSGVRMEAGFHCLPLCEQEALAVLSHIAEQDGILGFTAETTISEWLKGNLHKDANT